MRIRSLPLSILIIVGSMILAGTNAAGTSPYVALTPINGGAVGGTPATVDSTPGEQIDAHVSGNLASYTDQSAGSGVIRFHDFLNPANSGLIPSASLFDVDELSSIDGNHIAFARQHADLSRSVMVFDRVTSAVTEIGAGQGARAGLTGIGGDTVAFVNTASGNGDIVAGRISAPAAPLVNLSSSADADSSLAVSPQGNVIVWQSCIGGLVTCNILKSENIGGTWGSPEIVSATGYGERNPATDGLLVTFDSNRPGTLGGSDIFFQAVTGAGATQLAIDGAQRNPSVSDGDIVFESKAVGGTTWDLFVYRVATNTLFQITDTPGTNEILSDVTTLASGDVRVTWAADDDFFPGEHNIYARTFRLPGTTYVFSGFFQPIDNLPTLNLASAGSSIPVKFSLGGNQGLAILATGSPASSPIACDANDPGVIIEETATAGNSSLTYNATTDQYSYVWKTEKAWKGTCRMFVLQLNDGTVHQAKFRFR